MRHKDEGGSTADVRFGSKAEIAARPRNVRFTPKSGHQLSALGCLLCAKSRRLVPIRSPCRRVRRLGGMVSPSVLQFSPKSVQPMDFLCLTVVSDFADFDDFDWQVLNNAGGPGWSRQTVYLLLRPSRFWP